MRSSVWLASTSLPGVTSDEAAALLRKEPEPIRASSGFPGGFRVAS